MYQQSVDRSHGSARSDLVLFIALLAAFFLVGTIAVVLENHFSSRIPRYVFIGLVLACLYLVYRLRLVGYRYTVFYEEPKAVYDERFGEEIMHEDYPYPVGTLVFERIVSAKGTIVFTVDRKDILEFLAPGEKPGVKADKEYDFSCTKREKAHTLVFAAEGGNTALYFDPDEEFSAHIRTIMDMADTEAPETDGEEE